MYQTKLVAMGREMVTVAKAAITKYTEQIQKVDSFLTLGTFSLKCPIRNPYCKAKTATTKAA